MIKKAFLIIYLNILFPILNLFSKKDTYVFMSLMGIKPTGNPYAFFKYIKEKNPDAKCIWLTNSKNKNFHLNYKNVEYVPTTSFKLLNTYLKAKMTVSDGFIPFLLWKNKRCCNIETFHGTIVKYVYLDDKLISLIERLFLAKYVTNIDLLVVGNNITEKYVNNHLKKYFKGKMLKMPSLNLDTINNNFENKDLLLSKAKGKKIVLFAPTFREYGDDELIKQTNNIIHLFSQTQLNEKYCLYIRLHHLTASKINNSDKYIDVSSYENTEELLQVTDYIITDYSSILFDFISQDKIGIFYQYDFDKYYSTRGLYYKDFEKEFGIKTAYNFDDLKNLLFSLDTLSNIDYKVQFYGKNNGCKELYTYLDNHKYL